MSSRTKKINKIEQEKNSNFFGQNCWKISFLEQKTNYGDKMTKLDSFLMLKHTVRSMLPSQSCPNFNRI